MLGPLECGCRRCSLLDVHSTTEESGDHSAQKGVRQVLERSERTKLKLSPDWLVFTHGELSMVSVEGCVTGPSPGHWTYPLPAQTIDK